MIKVKLTNYRIGDTDVFTPDYYKMFEIFQEMKQWCRDSFGSGYDKSTKKWNWRSRMVYEDIIEYDFYNGYMQFPVFYFTSEEKANWFLIRWG